MKSHWNLESRHSTKVVINFGDGDSVEKTNETNDDNESETKESNKDVSVNFLLLYVFISEYTKPYLLKYYEKSKGK